MKANTGQGMYGQLRKAPHASVSTLLHTYCTVPVCWLKSQMTNVYFSLLLCFILNFKPLEHFDIGFRAECCPPPTFSTLTDLFKH